ncbi:MAG TPA: ribbon-helix-helix protein, CopG family [Pseudonocardiaceae bacterium]|jgi:hypothetical protein|nr:ribbon-helix-helix protein, CopG family [Pseudonocardiaceae bacterium]
MVPEQVFERVRQRAERLGISRSEFFSRAAEMWADEMEGAELTEAINDAIDAAGEQAGDDGSTEFARRAAQRLVARDGRTQSGLDSPG